jgi:hypothetical protein
MRIQGFDEQKLQFTYVQATGEAFSPQKRTFSTSKNEIYQLFSMFVGHFYIPGFGYGSRDPIEISKSNPDLDTDPDPQQCKIHKVRPTGLGFYKNLES